ncbi:MAG: BspA family leucine-rich repeat surface protein [Clostridiales bacterium]|nr:BspA family leucine-rich repeat surface protein [Clostridiales bacterium]
MKISTKKICAAMLSAAMAGGIIPLGSMTVFASESKEIAKGVYYQIGDTIEIREAVYLRVQDEVAGDYVMSSRFENMDLELGYTKYEDGQYWFGLKKNEDDIFKLKIAAEEDPDNDPWGVKVRSGSGEDGDAFIFEVLFDEPEEQGEPSDPADPTAPAEPTEPAGPTKPAEPEAEYNVSYDEETGTVTLSGKLDSTWWLLEPISKIRNDIKHIVIAEGATVEDAKMLFYQLKNVETIDLAGLDTSGATNMSFMFAGCTSLTELDLTDFDTKNVTGTENMFSDCTNLVTIKVGNGWNLRKVDKSDDMFTNCTSIRGDLGTTYMPEHVDKSYAQIDYMPIQYCYVRYNDAKVDGYSLILEGALTFRVFVKVPEGFDLTGTRVKFTVGSAAPITVNDPKYYDNIIRAYCYYCPVTVNQMADTIRTEFFYGEDGSEVRTHETNVEEYLAGVALKDRARPLAEALLRYGYYSQQYLSRVNGWTIGEDHAAMDDYSFDYDIDDIRGKLTAPTVDGFFSENFKVTANLRLGETVSMSMKLTAKGNKSYNLTYEDGSVLDDDGKVYTAVFDNINQEDFDDVKVVCCGGDRISISVNNYIKTVLDKYSASADNRDYCIAVCALYDVGVLADKYINYR